MLRVEDLHKSFDDFKAVNGAHLTVEKGQLVAVIGPNGAGKTTLVQPDYRTAATRYWKRSC